MIELILEVKNIRKIYGHVDAVNGISFAIAPGEIVGLLGPNGAGKTTTISIILGLLEQTEGQVRIFGKEFRANRSEILSRVNFAATYAQLPGNLTIWQNLFIFAKLYGVSSAKEKVERAIAEFDLEQFRNTRANYLSSGEQSRLGLAKALLNEPKLLLLDEPTASIDPSTAQILRECIREYARTHRAGILFTSHNMYEVEEMCNRVLFISHGKILLEGDPKTLPSQYGKKSLEELFIAVAREPLSLESQAI